MSRNIADNPQPLGAFVKLTPFSFLKAPVFHGILLNLPLPLFKYRQSAWPNSNSETEPLRSTIGLKRSGLETNTSPSL